MPSSSASAPRTRHAPSRRRPAGSVAGGSRPGPGCVIDSGVEEGTVVSGDYDPMLAKILVVAPDRDGAIRACASGRGRDGDRRHPDDAAVPRLAAAPSGVRRRGRCAPDLVDRDWEPAALREAAARRRGRRGGRRTSPGARRRRRRRHPRLDGRPTAGGTTSWRRHGRGRLDPRPPAGKPRSDGHDRRRTAATRSRSAWTTTWSSSWTRPSAGTCARGG